MEPVAYIPWNGCPTSRGITGPLETESATILLPLSQQVLQRKIEGLLQPEQDPQALKAKHHYQLGLQLVEKESWGKALQFFQMVLTTQQDPEVYYKIGFIKAAQGLYEEGTQLFRRATQINNTFAKTYERMGECYIKLERPRLVERASSAPPTSIWRNTWTTTRSLCCARCSKSTPTP
ncbi:hypothetical protein DFAR_1540035 [Desulfarculales bacterium]